MDTRKLTARMRSLLDSLSVVEWKKAPPFTRSETVLALQKRGLIEIRIGSDVLWSYHGLEMRRR